jgi:hypothetical protein
MTEGFSDSDAEGFVNYQTHLGDNMVGFYEEQLKHDYRRNKGKGDIYQKYNNFKDWSNTAMAKDVERTIDLIPYFNEISVKNFRSALTSTFAMTRDYADKVIKEVRSNDVRIKSRNHTLDRSVDEIRLKKIK